MNLNELKYKELREKLFAINLQLELHKKSENKEFLSNLKEQHKQIKKELGKFKIEQKQRGGK